MDSIPILFPDDWTEYELIDSGDGAKLERFNTYTIARPDPRAFWLKSNPSLWGQTNATPPPTPWRISYHGITFNLRQTESKHVGVFPEQAVNWTWIEQQISGRNISVLNLFAYTGGATMFAAKSGTKVTHVDSAKNAIDWAHENIRTSNLERRTIRWIEEDAYKFVQREERRGNTYDAIIMDPPRFGRGSKGEVWKIEKNLPKLLAACKNLLSPNPRFILLNAYTADLSPLALYNLMIDTFGSLSGKFEVFELVLRQTSLNRFLPQGITIRWTK